MTEESLQTQHPKPQPPLSQSDERMWAMLAHLSVLANLVSGILGPVAAIVIYIVYKDRSKYVAYQSLQSFIMQMILWVGGGILTAVTWFVVGLLSALIVGICLIPFAILVSAIPLVALVYGVVAGIQCNQGYDFRYWLIGDWVRDTLESN